MPDTPLEPVASPLAGAVVPAGLKPVLALVLAEFGLEKDEVDECVARLVLVEVDEVGLLASDWTSRTLERLERKSGRSALLYTSSAP